MQKIQFQLRDTNNQIIQKGQTLDLSNCKNVKDFSRQYHKITCLLSDEEWRLIDLSTNSEIITEFDEIEVIWNLYQNTKIQKDAQFAYTQFKNIYNISESFDECYLGKNTSEENFAKQYYTDRKLIHEDFPQRYINWSQLVREAEMGTALGQWKYFYLDNICYVFQIMS